MERIRTALTPFEKFKLAHAYRRREVWDWGYSNVVSLKVCYNFNPESIGWDESNRAKFIKYCYNHLMDRLPPEEPIYHYGRDF